MSKVERQTGRPTRDSLGRPASCHDAIVALTWRSQRGTGVGAYRRRRSPKIPAGQPDGKQAAIHRTVSRPGLVVVCFVLRIVGELRRHSPLPGCPGAQRAVIDGQLAADPILDLGSRIRDLQATGHRLGSGYSHAA
jgi:hypothetical protein